MLIFYIHFGIPSEIFPFILSINILHAFLTSRVCCAADLTVFKPTHYLMELGRAMRHWDRCFVRRGRFAHAIFLSTNVAHTDRQADRLTGRLTDRHTDRLAGIQTD